MRPAPGLAVLLLLASSFVRAQTAPPQLVAPGVWFLPGDASKGYCNNVVIEMQDYLIVVDANYPGRAKELVDEVKTLSPKPVRYVFDTHAHRDHSYGNIVWTRAGATTMAFPGVIDEMNRYEPQRWNQTASEREDVRALGLHDAPRPQKILPETGFTLKDATHEVRFLTFGWAHTEGDGFVWLPKERILCTGDAAVNGPRNKLADADIANWPKVLSRAQALLPAIVLPGHGGAGGPEILAGQRQFLLDLYAAVEAQVVAGRSLADVEVHLPEADANWIPRSLAFDIEATYREITGHTAAGAQPHEWK